MSWFHCCPCYRLVCTRMRYGPGAACKKAFLAVPQAVCPARNRERGDFFGNYTLFSLSLSVPNTFSRICSALKSGAGGRRPPRCGMDGIMPKDISPSSSFALSLFLPQARPRKEAGISRPEFAARQSYFCHLRGKCVARSSRNGLLSQSNAHIAISGRGISFFTVSPLSYVLGK